MNQTEKADLERRKEVAMQKIRPMICKKLDAAIDRIEEDVEELVVDELVEAGIDAPILDPDSEEADAAMELVQECMDEAIKYWAGSKHGPVWVMLSFDNDAGIKGLEVEVFGDRPRTWNGDPGAWPCWFRVYEGNIDGGDTIIADSRGANFG